MRVSINFIGIRIGKTINAKFQGPKVEIHHKRVLDWRGVISLLIDVFVKPITGENVFNLYYLFLMFFHKTFDF